MTPKTRHPARLPWPNYTEAIREDISGLVVGLPRHFFFDPRPSVDPEVQSVVETAVKELESLGPRVEEVTIPSLEYVRSANSIIMLTEAYSFHADYLRNRPGDYGEQARVRFRTGGLLSASDYLQATKIRQVAKREFAQALEKVDVLVSPTMTQPAPPFQSYDPATTARDPSFTAPYNFTGLPAISVPCGFTQKGLPVGMQIAGRPFAEPEILRAAHTYERHAGWYKRRPPV